MSHEKSSAEIEREIENERSALTDSLNRLQDQFSPDRLIETVSREVGKHGSDIGRSLSRAVKDNPVAFAVASAGAIWLVASMRSGDDDVYRSKQGAAYDRRSHGPVGGFRSSGGDDVRLEDRLDAVRVDASGRYDPSTDPDLTVWSRARLKFGEMRDAAETGASSAKSMARDLLDRLYEGTEKMSEAARERVAEARMKAYEAQKSVEQRAREAAGGARRHIEEEPLIYGAVALAVGALVGALLPRTETEDRALGAYRDRAFDEAERIFHEEKAKLKAVADAALAETKAVARDAAEKTPDAKSALDKAEDKAKSAAERIADAAKSEADRQGLGNPSS